MKVPGAHYVTPTTRRWRPYDVVRAIVRLPGQRGGGFGYDVSYEIVGRRMTNAGAHRLANKLNAQEA